ncbi:MAG: adenosylhomocysteinase [Planctomycetales bacterium]|nr:adenosylhomocysteinase [Planctomycetales bacterium]
MSAIFTIQVLAQYALSRSRDEYLVRVRVLPKLRNDEVARLQLDKLGVKFAKLTA